MDYFVIAHLDAVNKCLVENDQAPVLSVRAVSEEDADWILNYVLSDKHDMDHDGYLYDIEMWPQEQLGYDSRFQRFHQEQVIRYGQEEGDILTAILTIAPYLDNTEDKHDVVYTTVNGISLSDIMRNTTRAAGGERIKQANITRIEIALITRNGNLNGAHVWFMSRKQ